MLHVLWLLMQELLNHMNWRQMVTPCMLMNSFEELVHTKSCSSQMELTTLFSETVLNHILGKFLKKLRLFIELIQSTKLWWFLVSRSTSITK